MKELKDIVAAAFDNIVASGAIEQAIEKKLGECITSAIDSQLRSYSDFGKAIEEKVKQAIGVNLAEIDLPSYADLIGNILRRQVEAGMQNEATKHLEKRIGELLAPAPAEITLKKLIENFIEARIDSRGDSIRGDDFTLIISHSEGSTAGYKNIFIDEDAHTTKYSCSIQIGVNAKGEVYSLKIGGNNVKDQLFIGPLYNFERDLFQLYTAKSKLIVPDDADPSDYPTRFPYHGDDD